MKITTNNRRIFITAILVAVLFVSFGLPSQTRAADEQVGAIQRKMAGTMYSILVITNEGIAFLVKTLQATLYFKVDAEFPVVKDMWKIVRDFANMLFIIVLIAVAMGTVFNVKSFGFGGFDLGGDFFMPFLIAALLINFSLTIGGLIINGVQIINDTFLASIGNFQDRLGSVLNPKVLIGLPADASDSAADSQFSLNPLSSNLTQNMVVQLFFTLILSVMLFFSLLVPVIFTLARIPYLMLLLVFAPAAWLFGILPGTKKYSSDWWNQFWGWNLFLPFYLLVLYFGLFFLSYQKTILESIDRTAGAGITGFANLTLSTVFFYFVTAMILVMGTAAAVNTSFVGGTTAGKVAGWARGKVGEWWFGGRFATGATVGAIAGGVQGFRDNAKKGVGEKITGTVGGILGGAQQGLFSSKDVAEAIQKRGKEKFEEIKKEGLPTRIGRVVYGGTRKGSQFGAQISSFLGDTTAMAAQLKRDVADFRKEYEDANLTPQQLREVIAGNSSDQNKLAAYELLKSKKVLGATEIKNAYNLYHQYAPRSATSFALDIEYDKLSRGERKEIYTGINDADIKRKVAKVIAAEGEFASAADLQEAASLFDPNSAKYDFLVMASKKSLVESYRAAVELGVIPPNPNGTAPTFEELLKKAVSKKGGEDKLSLLTDDLFYTSGGDRRPLPGDAREQAAEIATRSAKERDYGILREIIREELADNQLRGNLLRNGKITEGQIRVIEKLIPGST